MPRQVGSSPVISFRTLGTLELRDSDGSELSRVLAQPKRLALLAYLAAATPRGFHRRDSILGIFWPELDQERARGALGQAVHFLRRALGPETLVNRGGQEMGLDPQRIWCDVPAFEEALQAGRTDEALELYRGDLLSGFFIDGAPEFETWVELERARLRTLALDAALARADELESQGQAAGAARTLRRALTIAPENEQVVRRLLRVLDATGDRAGAIRAYEGFARRLERELDVEPAPETTALLERIRSRDQPREIAQRRVEGDVSSGTAEGVALGAIRPVEPADRESTASRQGRPRLALRYAIGALAGIVLVALAASVWLAPSRRTHASAGLIAVAPLTPSVPDTALVRLGRDLVVTVSANLDGVGELRTADAMAVLAQLTSEDVPVSLDEALGLGRRLGAAQVLHGGLTRVGDRVRVDAGLYSTSDGADREAVARVSVLAGAADLIALSDSLTWVLLREIWGRGTPPGLSSAALSTRSLPALRAFLEGEKAIAESRWRQAPDHFARAMELDSTFWFAYWRFARAMGYRSRPYDPAIWQTVLDHRHEFPERDRMYIESTLADSLSELLEKGRELVERYPTYWIGWFGYADQLVHNGPFAGMTATDARLALERTAALNRDDPTVWQHIFWLTLPARDTLASRYALRRLEELGHGSATLAEVGIDQTLFFRYLQRLGERRQEPDTALADSLAAALVGYSGPIDHDVFVSTVSSYGFHRGELFLSERTLRRPVPPTIAASLVRSMALAWAGRGAWDSAMVVMRRYVNGYPGYESLLHAYRLASVGIWVGALPEGSGAEWRAALEAQVDHLPAPNVAELVWLDGLRATARGDGEGLRQAIQRLEDAEPPAGPFLRRSLGAFELKLRGEVAAAAEAMAELERERTEHYWFRRIGNQHPYLTAVNRLAASSWLLEAGDTAMAGRLLTWHEAVQFPSHLAASADATLSALVYYERARIAEAMGLSDEAEEHYVQFLRRYDAPVEAHRPMMERARDILAGSAEERRISF